MEYGEGEEPEADDGEVDVGNETLEESTNEVPQFEQLYASLGFWAPQLGQIFFDAKSLFT